MKALFSVSLTLVRVSFVSQRVHKITLLLSKAFLERMLARSGLLYIHFKLFVGLDFLFVIFLLLLALRPHHLYFLSHNFLQSRMDTIDFSLFLSL